MAIKQLIFKNKKSHVKKLNSFQHFVNITTNSKSPAIKFFKTGLMYAYINIKIKAKQEKIGHGGQLVYQKQDV